MKSQDKSRFALALLAVAEYYEKSLSQPVIALWWRGLELFDIGAIEHAFDIHTKNPDTGQFMPRIADITRMIDGGTQEGALVAWAKVDKAVRQIGPYASVVFDDKIIHRVLHEMGGWAMLGSKLETDWPFVAKEFENRYRSFRLRGVIDYPPCLVGIAEAHNTCEGHQADLPVLIGDVERAKLVLQGGSRQPLLLITHMPLGVQ